MFAGKVPPQHSAKETEEEPGIGEFPLVVWGAGIEGLRSRLPRDSVLAHRQLHQPEEQEAKNRAAYHKR